MSDNMETVVGYLKEKMRFAEDGRTVDGHPVYIKTNGDLLTVEITGLQFPAEQEFSTVVALQNQLASDSSGVLNRALNSLGNLVPPEFRFSREPVIKSQFTKVDGAPDTVSATIVCDVTKLDLKMLAPKPFDAEAFFTKQTDLRRKMREFMSAFSGQSIMGAKVTYDNDGTATIAQRVLNSTIKEFDIFPEGSYEVKANGRAVEIELKRALNPAEISNTLSAMGNFITAHQETVRAAAARR